MNETEVILPSDARAAVYRSDIQGWVSRHGRYCGDGPSGEHMARYDGSTHSACSGCGVACSKCYPRCNSCVQKDERTRWEAYPVVEWEGEPLTLLYGEEYFWDAGDLYSHCDSNETNPEDLLLVVAEPCALRQVREDYWEDDMPEDFELPKPIADALNTLNNAIAEHGKAVSYWPGEERVKVTWADIGGAPEAVKS